MIYTFKQKEKLLTRIANNATKKDYIKIFQIIYTPTLQITQNNNGLFIQFNNLPNDIYIKIEKYLNNISKTNDIFTNVDTK